MNILHAADLHQGLVTHSVPGPGGIPSRILDLAEAWRSLVDLAEEHRPAAVVLAGDTFHVPNPGAVELALFGQEHRRLEGLGIPLVLIAGNHDRAAHPGRPSIVELFGGHTLPGWAEVGGLRFALLPSVSRHQLFGALAENAWLRGVDEDLVEGLRRVVTSLRQTGADVLVGHWPVQGALLGAEREISLIDEPMLAPADLAGPWAWVAFGHIHRSQLLAGDLRGSFSGSLARMNFGEAAEDKGAWLVDLEELRKPVASWMGRACRFLEIPGREFFTLEGPEPIPNGLDLEGAIVRVRACPPGEAERMRRELMAAGAQSVRVEIERPEREAPRAPEIVEAEGPLEALDRWLELRAPEESRPRIRERARQLLEESP